MTVSSSAAGITSDSYFNLVSLLLPGNGTNGAQNNTFLDSSASPLTVTRNGSVTQGAFSPFTFGSGTQTDGYYSGYFDGSGDYLSSTLTASAPGTGSFTYECWFYIRSLGSPVGIFNTRSGDSTDGFDVNVSTSNQLQITYTGSVLGSVSGIIANQWNHLAIVRNGSTNWTVYINGNVGTTISNSTNFTSTTMLVGAVALGGSSFNGYISNFRYVTSAVYTSSFTPTTSPLTAITGTKFPTCQSSRFIDNSTNAFAITAVGNSQPTVVNPFGMTDWSGYFDGSGDYLNLTQSAFAVGTGNFTLEAWVFLTSAPGTEAGVISSFNTATGQGFYLAVNSSRQPFFAIGNGGVVNPTVTGAAIPLNTWVHLAGVRSSGTISLYVNGSSVGTPTSATASIDRTLLGIGLAYPNSPQLYITGCISNARITSNAVYTSNFTVPTAPLTAISGTQLLTCQSSTFIDNSPNAFTITVNGNAYTGTLNNPFGSIVNYTTPPLQAWSNYFSSTGDNLRTGTMTALGSGDFTLEMWVFPLSFANYRLIWDNRTSDPDTNGFAFGLDANAKVYLYTNNLFAITTTTALVANTWTHIALVRNGSGSGNVKIYINGVADATTATNTANMSRTLAYIGNDFDGTGSPFVGYLSNMRATTRALYSTTFTPSTSPLSAVANTVLLTCQSNRFVDNSINQVAITRAGDTSVQPFSPFNPDAAYSTSSIGASMYFDGASKLTTSASIDISGVFTIESWFNSTNAGGWFFTIGNFPVYIDVSAGTITLDKSSVGNQLVTTANEQVKGSNCWKHLAITRDGSGLIRVFVNGVFLGSVSTGYSAGTLNGLGQYASYGGAWLGYACDFRVVVGTALYTSAFTPPTAPLTAVSGTAILLSGINAGIYDAAAKSDWETIGNSQISTVQSKFGGSSMYFDGSGDALANLNSGQYNLFDFGTGDFTIEFWFYCINTTSGMVYTRAISGHNLCVVYVGANVTERVSFFATASGGGTAIQSAGTPVVSTWNHAAIVRQNGTVTVYLNGTGGTPASNTTNITAGSTYGSYVPTIGAYYHGGISFPFAGYIDDFRITKGYARYTANFTPPTAAFPTQ